jgi:hypothetical protein
MERARKGNKADKFIIYFQPNTNTYAPTHYLKMMYDEALSIDPENIVGLSVGTRPIVSTPRKLPCWKAIPTALMWTWRWVWKASIMIPWRKLIAAVRMMIWLKP